MIPLFFIQFPGVKQYYESNTYSVAAIIQVAVASASIQSKPSVQIIVELPTLRHGKVPLFKLLEGILH